MARPSHTTLQHAGAGALGGSAAWVFVLTLSAASGGGLFPEIMLGALAGMFIGGFLWSHDALRGRQFTAAAKRALFGAAAGLVGGAIGAALGNTSLALLGGAAAEFGGFRASAGVAFAVALGWAVLGAAVGASGGLMIRSGERTRYGLSGGAIGGAIGGLLLAMLSATSIWSALAGLALLGMSIGAFISLVEEAFVSAKVKVIKGRHQGREFPLLKDLNVLGRDDRSDVCLSGAEGVGMQHAAIKRKNGQYTIETDDQGKAVYVNQKMTHRSRLSDGDVIRVGSILLLFSAMRKAAASAGAAALFALAVFLAPGTGAMAGETASLQITQFDLDGFPVVKAYVSALDRAGRPVPGLLRDDLALQENGMPTTIEGMTMAGTAGMPEPLSLAVIIDRSGSMAGEKIRRARESVLRFLSLMQPGDRASLIAFSDEIEALEPLMGDRERLTNRVKAIGTGGNTALYDAIARGVESLAGAKGRRAVIVLTDGIANRGALTIDQSIEAASRAYVSVSVIGLGNDVRTARLDRIARETGGNYFFTPDPEGLADIYEAISRRIRNEYVVTYRTTARAEYLRNVSISLRTGRTATRAYFQPRSSLFGAGGSVPGWAFAIPVLSLAGLAGLSFRKVEHRYRTGHLSLVRGKGTKKDVAIGDSATIGRDERNSLGLFRDDAVSQQHAQVVKENGTYVIEDKGSAAGTFVNKKRVTQRQTLQDGDVISIGQATIVFSEASRTACPGCGTPMRTGAKFCMQCGGRANA